MRVFFKESGQISEITNQINKYKTDTYLLSMGLEDAIYIASDFPLNHFFVKVGETTNGSIGNTLIEYWSSNGWVPAANINDYTDSFSRSGFIEFTPDIDVSWSRENTNSSGQSVDDLESISVYGMYWIKLTSDIDWEDDVELNYIGHKFSDDYDLFSEYPLFNDAQFLTAFEANKTDWEEQAIKASDLIIQDLKRKRVILGAEQILDRHILLPASTSKTAEIIFNSFGKDYTEQRDAARKEYDTRMDLSQYVVDTNNDAIIGQIDIQARQGWVSR